MENFLTPLIDSWSKLNTDKLVILGNGESRSRGLDFARKNSLPVVSINTLDENSQQIFTIVTRISLLSQLEAENSDGIPLITPAGFPSSVHSVALPISEFEYIEGLTVKESSQVGFREDFVLITILELINLLANHGKQEDKVVEVYLYGFDFEIAANRVLKAEDLFLESLLFRQKSIFDMLLRQDKPFDYLILVNRSKTE